MPDTRIILKDGLVVKSHRLILSSNTFFHQLMSSSWVVGDNSTFLLPQHSVEDFLLALSLPALGFATNGAEALSSNGVDEMGASENSNNEITSSDSAQTKVEDSDGHDEVQHQRDNDEQVEEVGVILDENCLLSGFEPVLKQNLSPGFEEPVLKQNISDGFEKVMKMSPRFQPTNQQNLSPEFQPTLKEDLSPGFEKMMKQVETLRNRLQPDSIPSKSSFCKRRKTNTNTNNKRSVELISTTIGGDEMNSDQVLDTIQRTNVEISQVPSDQAVSVKCEETETKVEKNFSHGRFTLFPLKKGKKGMMFTKEDEHEWHLFKLNASKPRIESDYYHCHRC